jgi:hypothetical protein
MPMCVDVQRLIPVSATLAQGSMRMSEIRVAVILMVLGLLGLANGGFHYLREANAAGIVSIPASSYDSGLLSVSLWLGAAAIVAGVMLLLTRTKYVDLNR